MWSYDNDFARNVIIFGVDDTSSSHTYNKEKHLFSITCRANRRY